MKLLSWNILHGGGSRLDDILTVISGHEPDIVCLQEFRHGKTRAPLYSGLESVGLMHQYSPDVHSKTRNTMAVFSRQPFSGNTLVEGDSGSVRVIEMIFPVESIQAARVIAVSFPHKKEQIPVFDKLLDLPASYLAGDTLIIGDFNCGIPFEDSETRSFQATHMFQAMLKQGWVDSWRSRFPAAREYTWFSTQKGNGFRYDHALVSPSLDLRIEKVWYDHDAREQGISDHSPMVLELA